MFIVIIWNRKNYTPSQIQSVQRWPIIFRASIPCSFFKFLYYFPWVFSTIFNTKFSLLLLLPFHLPSLVSLLYSSHLSLLFPNNNIIDSFCSLHFHCHQLFYSIKCSSSYGPICVPLPNFTRFFSTTSLGCSLCTSIPISLSHVHTLLFFSFVLIYCFAVFLVNSFLSCIPSLALAAPTI